jgi:hypothetical protein
MLSMSLLFAGHETTTVAIGLGAVALLADPEQRRAVPADPRQVDSIAEEVLRTWVSVAAASCATPAPTSTSPEPFSERLVGGAAPGVRAAVPADGPRRGPRRNGRAPAAPADRLSDRVVEAGAGPGGNFPHYPAAATEVVAVEPERCLGAIATDDGVRASVPVEVVDGVAERLPVAEASVDAVVFCLVLCSVSDPQPHSPRPARAAAGR